MHDKTGSKSNNCLLLSTCGHTAYLYQQSVSILFILKVADLLQFMLSCSNKIVISEPLMEPA